MDEVTMSSPSQPLVRLSSVSKHFPTAGGKNGPTIRALSDIDLDIGRGEVVGVVGESGSGKSTLGRVILRLLDPTAGTVMFGDTDLTALKGAPLRRMRKHMQMIFQDPFSSLNPRMIVGDTLAESLRLHRGLSRKDAMEAAAELMALVGLRAEQLGRYPRAFSGGQRQRIAIARALASQPQFIVADEAVSALDVSVQAEIINLLQELQSKLSLAMMFISHDLSVVRIISDRVAVLYLGRIMETGPVEQVFNRPQHPYTAALIDAVPGKPQSERRYVLTGEIPSPAAPPPGCVFSTRCPFAVAECKAAIPAPRQVGDKHFKACIRDDLSL
jgi:oligopeptide/dipeptide ABC transporter ATP-binding protein